MSAAAANGLPFVKKTCFSDDLTEKGSEFRMERERVILHSDLNSFYASVETVLHPEYEGEALAVCGSTEDRHGIVLAKSEKAKMAGVKTGMVCHEAKRLCPELIISEPHYEMYLEFSSLVRKIYAQYTDLIEPFGLDECWLDVTGSQRMFGGGELIANDIRNRVKRELGLTVSVGVSFCKSFAKLGSDMKKPDAVTVINRENFKSMLWGLPACELLFVGRATYKKLVGCGIVTIGDMAKLKKSTLEMMFGVKGRMLWAYANGCDHAHVMHKDFEFPVKSVGHGITCKADLICKEEVRPVLLELSRDIGHKLRAHKLLANGVSLGIKDKSMCYENHRCALKNSTRSPHEIAMAAYAIFEDCYMWRRPVRALTVTAINLVGDSSVAQTDLFTDYITLEKCKALDDAVDDINTRFGGKTLVPLSVRNLKKLPDNSSHETTLPGNFVY